MEVLGFVFTLVSSSVPHARISSEVFLFGSLTVIQYRFTLEEEPSGPQEDFKWLATP